MRARVREAADIVIAARSGIGLSEVARRMGCGTSTAGQHLNEARIAGLVQASGRGCKSVWLPAGVAAPIPRGSKAQVASVWWLAA